MRDLLQKTYKVKMSLPQTRVLIDRYDKNGDRKFTYREYKAMMEDLEDQDDEGGSDRAFALHSVGSDSVGSGRAFALHSVSCSRGGSNWRITLIVSEDG